MPLGLYFFFVNRTLQTYLRITMLAWAFQFQFHLTMKPFLFSRKPIGEPIFLYLQRRNKRGREKGMVMEGSKPFLLQCHPQSSRTLKTFHVVFLKSLQGLIELQDVTKKSNCCSVPLVISCTQNPTCKQ